jgi:predicted RNase H-like nuclease
LASTLVLGLDGYPGGWACVALEDGQVAAAFGAPAIDAALERFPDVAAIGIDMPFALMEYGPRRADGAARAFISPRASSVFSVPPAPALEAKTHAEAVAIAREYGGPAPSAQCFALFPKIIATRTAVASGLAAYEVHPEVSFRALGGLVLPRKRSWNGQRARVRLLEGAGIHLADCEADDIPADDLLDAAVAAWSAARIAGGSALTLPAEPTPEERVANMLVWY